MSPEQRDNESRQFNRVTKGFFLLSHASFLGFPSGQRTCVRAVVQVMLRRVDHKVRMNREEWERKEKNSEKKAIDKRIVVEQSSFGKVVRKVKSLSFFCLLLQKGCKSRRREKNNVPTWMERRIELGVSRWRIESAKRKKGEAQVLVSTHQVHILYSWKKEHLDPWIRWRWIHGSWLSAWKCLVCKPLVILVSIAI